MLLVFLLIFHFKKPLAAINLFVNHNPNLNITKKELKKLLFATSQLHFIFNGKFHSQIDGPTMGSPLAPVLAKIFHWCL